MLDLDAPFLASGDKLVCFGDSLTAAGVYEDELRKLLPQNEIINAGRGGDKTPWALTRFQSAVLDVKPEALLIFLGANDAAVGRGCWADEPTVSPEAYRTNLIWMVHMAKLAGIGKFSIATPLGSFEGEAYLEQGDILRDYTLAARSAADQTGARLVPLDTRFFQWRGNTPMTEKVLTRDGTHPTEPTYRMIAGAMADAWHMR